nr:hypothetical protein [uncultured Halomonas sp.]
MDTNQRLKALQHALKLDRGDVARACKAGGYQASRNNVAHWLRGAGAELHKGAGYTPTGHTPYVPMPVEAFDAFCLGIGEVLDHYHQE